MNETTAVGIGAVAMLMVWKWAAAALAKKGLKRWIQHVVGGVAGVLVLALVVGILAPARQLPPVSSPAATAN
ncbi:hypothetical protein GCM10007350_13040 [Jeongeupia chitinilytica]|uniref:Uncharacterized protein n=2 Tax=Jeongeupia chitinilytica TaxID=1041641 RepID=A0ABQ3GXS4_9NEIS|nr:hypothetical protein GCM10007350_13040 [Jeongeupia chitinilytica]